MASFKYKNTFINNTYTIVGPTEGKGQIKSYDKVTLSNYYNEKSFENAEIRFQKSVINSLIYNNNIDLCVSGDLMNQLTTSYYTNMFNDLPILGVYSACASFVEGMIILSNMIEANQIESGICVTSSHNSNCEKQFRYPVEYGAPKPKRSTFTVTGAAGCEISNIKSNIKIESATLGTVFDSSIKDSFNMGGVMTLAAYNTILEHLKDLKRNIEYYDLIITGDLGIYGKKILKELFKNNNLKIKKLEDAGTLIYKQCQKTNAGASGPTVLPLVMFAKILKEKKFNKILMVGTGSLHSPLMVNKKYSIPTISHVISLEVK